MALPTSINNATPLGSASPATIDDQFRDLKLFLTDLFGVPNATNISANVMTVVAGGLDSINFANSGANAAVAGELQRNGANLTFHDGTSARTTVWAETTQTISGNKTFSGTTSLGTVATGTWNGTAIGTVYGGTNANSSAATGIARVAAGTWSFSDQGALDAALGTAVRGDIVYGNSTPDWARLAIGANGTYLSSNGTDVSWATVASTPPVFNRVVRTAGDVTTTSTSLVDLTGASVTFTTGAFPEHVSFAGNAQHSGAAGDVFLNVDIDGALQFGTSGHRAAAPVAGAAMDVSFGMDSAALTAASHTTKIQWKVDTGTGTIEAATDQNYVFSAHEIR